jgi:hypothetical protein
MSVMKNYSMQYNITQPYRSYGCLWEAIETVSICDEMELLEQQLKTTALATRMLKDIGVNVK